jgi:CheY-like chemotaxis protein
MMPMVDGFATLEQIKRRTVAHCKVIFLSAKNKEKDIKKEFR